MPDPDAASRRPRRPALARAAAVALVAAAIGTGAVLAVHDLLSPGGTAAMGQPSSPVTGYPGSGGSGGAGVVPGGLQPGVGEGFVVGQVLAVSRSSITIGRPGRSITAAITGSTRITAAGGASGIKAGDEVSARLSVDGSRVTATEIDDPPRLPGGGSQP